VVEQRASTGTQSAHSPEVPAVDGSGSSTIIPTTQESGYGPKTRQIIANTRYLYSSNAPPTLPPTTISNSWNPITRRHSLSCWRLHHPEDSDGDEK
jgi:hypothetical protein